MIGFYLWYTFSLEITSFFAVLILPSAIAGLIIRIIPTKNSQKKTNKKKSYYKEYNKKKNLTDIDLLKADKFTMEGTDFECICFLYFLDKGYKPEITPKSGDHGVDLVVKDPKDSMKIAIQCKRRKDPIGNNHLIKLYGGKRAYNCVGTLFITTSSYTKKAMEYADAVGMELWNRLIVRENICKWQKEKLRNIS
jgi:restriction system protein